MTVATALTVYGIETPFVKASHSVHVKLQQLLPFTVLKPPELLTFLVTAKGCNSSYRLRY